MALAILGNGQIENRSRCNYTLRFLQNTALLILRKMKIFNLHTKGQNKLCKQCTCVHTSCVLQISAKLTFAKACWEASQTL